VDGTNLKVPQVRGTAQRAPNDMCEKKGSSGWGLKLRFEAVQQAIYVLLVHCERGIEAQNIARRIVASQEAIFPEGAEHRGRRNPLMRLEFQGQ